MRFTIPASTQARLRPVRIFHSKVVSHVKIQVFDPVTVFVSARETDLQTPDAAGNATKGFQYGQGLTDMWYVSGELWVTCNQAIEIEAEAWPLGGLR